MKTLIFLILAFLLLFSISKAQSPVPDPDTTSNPVKQIDPEVKQEPANIHYVDEQVRIGVEQLPSAVKDSLKRLEPAAWEKSVIYRNKNQKIYTVEVRDGGQEKTYHFNSDGKLLRDQPARKKKKK